MTIKFATNKDMEVIYSAVPRLFKEAMSCRIAVSDDVLKALSKELVSQGAQYFVWKDDELIKGFILYDTKFNDLTQQEYGFIYELYVFKPYRNMGGARKLMQFIQAHVHNKGLRTLKLNVFTSNTAQHFYAALGYQPEQTTMTLTLEQSDIGENGV